MEMINLPLRYQVELYNIAMERSQSEAGKKMIEADAMEDALEELT